MAGTFTNLIFHIIFSTKDRVPRVDDAIENRLYQYIGEIIRGEGGTLLEIGGVSDHVHILTKFKAKYLRFGDSPPNQIQLVGMDERAFRNRRTF